MFIFLLYYIIKINGLRLHLSTTPKILGTTLIRYRKWRIIIMTIILSNYNNTKFKKNERKTYAWVICWQGSYTTKHEVSGRWRKYFGRRYATDFTEAKHQCVSYQVCVLIRTVTIKQPLGVDTKIYWNTSIYFDLYTWRLVWFADDGAQILCSKT